MLKKVSFLFLLILLFICVTSLFGQSAISGKVTRSNGEGIADANVFIPQAKIGSKTDKDGEYRIQFPSNLTNFSVEISAVGFRTLVKEIKQSPTENSEHKLDATLVEGLNQVPTVSVTIGIPQATESIPLNIEILDSSKIATSGKVNLSETLAGLPGVSASSFGLGIGKPVLRGLTNANVVMLNNGSRLENFNFSSNHAFLLDEFTADRIEVVKGAVSLVYGSDAVGGVINVLKETPVFDNRFDGDLTSQFNSNTAGFTDSVGLRAGFGGFFGSLRGTIKSNEDYFDGRGQRVPNSRFNEHSINSSFGLRTNFGLFRLSYDANRPRFGLINANSISLVNTLQELQNDRRDSRIWYQNLKNDFFQSNNTFFLSKNILDIDLSYQANRRQGIGGAYNAANRVLTIPIFASMNLETLTYSVKFTVPRDKYKMLFGMNGSRVTNDADETKPNNPLLDSKVNDIGGYFVASYNLSEKFDIVGGLRFDHRKMESFPTRTATTNQFRIDRSTATVTGSLGAAYKINDSNYLSFNFASGFRSPSIPELSQNGIHSSIYEQGDPTLINQRNYQFDFGYRGGFDRFSFCITPFVNVVSGFINLVQTTENAPIGSGKIFRHVQNDAVLYGSEFRTGIVLPKSVSLRFLYNLLRSDVRSNPTIKHLAFMPQDRFISEIQFAPEKIGFLKTPSVTLDNVYTFKQDLLGQNERITAPYNVINFKLGSQISLFGQKPTIFLSFNNILDRAYVDHLSVIKTLNIHAIGRNAVFGIRFPFSFVKKD